MAYMYVCVILHCAVCVRVQMCTFIVAISVEGAIGGQNASRGKLDNCFARVVVVGFVFALCLCCLFVCACVGGTVARRCHCLY